MTNNTPTSDPIVRALIGFAVIILCLVVVVVVVGLVRGTLDPTGTATMLGGIFTGVVGGLILRAKGGDDK